MKRVSFGLDQRQVQQLFSAVREKSDVIRLIMNLIKIMLINDELPPDRRCGDLVLHVSQMSRVLLFTESKFFSVNFPFAVYLDEGVLRFSSIHCDDVDNKVTSEILSIFNKSSSVRGDDIYSFAEAIFETQDDNSNFWGLVRELMMFEDGYLRYDHDPVRANGRHHPLHHLDICYSSAATYKVGLNTPLDSLAFEDLLNLGSECRFLEG